MHIQRISTMFVLCAGLVLASSAIAQSEDPTPMPGPTGLTLLNGWYNAPFSTSNAEVEVVNGIVHFKGAIASIGTNDEAFVLPKAFRPSSYVYVPIDLKLVQNGRLIIYPTGEVRVSAENSLTYAEGFTSLDGASFPLNGSGFKSLTLLNGWQDYGDGVAKAEVKNINGIVHLRGAIATAGTKAEPFVLPTGFRPANEVYVAVDLCDGHDGRLIIAPNGTVTVEAEGAWSDAQCFTSLDGAWFVAKDSGFKTLSLVNGWVDYGGGTAQAKAKISSGVVYLQGGIQTSGPDSDAFVMPSSMTPATNVYVPVDLCGGAKGRIVFTPDGFASVQSETSFSKAQCFTSLEGVSFVK
jgi:hypothetical protein